MIYTPLELKDKENIKKVKTFLENNFEKFITQKGGFLDIPEDWDLENISTAIKILKNYNWEANMDDSISVFSGEKSIPKKRLSLIPIITMTQAEYNINNLAKTAIASEMVKPNAEELKINLIKNEDEKYPPFEIKEGEKNG